jgi:hypothetical protein
LRQNRRESKDAGEVDSLHRPRLSPRVSDALIAASRTLADRLRPLTFSAASHIQWKIEGTMTVNDDYDFSVIEAEAARARCKTGVMVRLMLRGRMMPAEL